MKYAILKNNINEGIKNVYKHLNGGCEPTGDVLLEIAEEEMIVAPQVTRHPIFKGEINRTGYARDCGDHYIIRRFGRYDRLEKGTLELTTNVSYEQ